MDHPTAPDLRKLIDRITEYIRLQCEYGARGLDRILVRANASLQATLEEVRALPADAALAKREPNDLPASQMVASAYRVVPGPGTIAVHGAHLGEDLPSYAAPKDQTMVRSEFEASSAAGNWSIWRIDSQVLAAMGDANHASLLHWLGQNHACAWCAPVHDIQQYRMKERKS